MLSLNLSDLTPKANLEYELLNIYVSSMYMCEDDYSIFWGTILFLFCFYFVTNLWNKCFIITDALSGMVLQKSIILSESNEKRIPNMGRAVSGLVIQLCLLRVIRTSFGLYDADLNHSLD